MRSGLRAILIAAFVASHAAVLSAGPALHGLLGLDHGRAGASFPDHEGTGGHRGVLSNSTDDCVACHIVSLVQFNPEPGPSRSILRVENAPVDPNPLPHPTDARGRFTTRAPPLAPHHLRSV